MTRSNSNPYFLIRKPDVISDCPNCRHAIVGKGRICYCDKGRWQDIDLDAVPRIGIWLKCGKFESLED